ncbi:MAG TPA: RsmB/NOP family class I SAM-dependent RNA methyltransferase [Kofleriaceae bacterium]
MPDLDKLSDQKLAAHVLEGGRLRALVLELWQRTRMDWGFVTDRLATTFRKETWLGAHERRFASETLYGLVRHLRRVDAALDRGRSVKKSPRDAERLVALLVLEKLVTPARAQQAEPGLDWARVAAIDEQLAAERKPVRRIALGCSMPDWLSEMLVADWGDDAETLARALNERAPMTIRANTIVGTRAALAAQLAAEKITTHDGRWIDTALHVDTRTNLFGLAAFKSGALEAQDEGSQLLAELVVDGLPEKPLVVDLCAGAGGKTLALAARLGNRGRIVASDVDAAKLDELRRRARRAQVSNAQAVHLDGGIWPRELDVIRGKADAVLVDAPCSGLGALRRNPEARWRLRAEDLPGFATRQREILANARSLLAPGGRLVYATCTLLGVENSEVVDAVIASAADSDTRLERVAQTGPFARGGAFTCTPHQHGTDGFFAQVLRRA